MNNLQIFASVVCRYEIMCLCWKENPLMRPTFADITKRFQYYLQTYKVNFHFFSLSFLISYWTFVSTNHWFSMHRPLPNSPVNKGINSQAWLDKMPWFVWNCPHKSRPWSYRTGLLERNVGKFYCLLPYYFLKGSDGQRKGRTPSDTELALKTQGNSDHWYKKLVLNNNTQITLYF